MYPLIEFENVLRKHSGKPYYGARGEASAMGKSHLPRIMRQCVRVWLARGLIKWSITEDYLLHCRSNPCLASLYPLSPRVLQSSQTY